MSPTEKTLQTFWVPTPNAQNLFSLLTLTCYRCNHFHGLDLVGGIPLVGGLSWGGCVNDVVLVFVKVSRFPEEVSTALVVDSVLVLVHALTVYTHLEEKCDLCQSQMRTF